MSSDRLFQGYEYFGYDPATYFSSDADENSFNQDSSFIIEDGHCQGAITDESQEGRESRGDRQEQAVLEIDLDQVEEREGCGGKNVRSEQNQILCKWRGVDKSDRILVDLQFSSEVNK